MLYGTIGYVVREGEVLMIKKNERANDPNSGFYALPGGKLELSEKGSNPSGRLENVVREVRDETGLVLKNPELAGTILFDNQGRTFDNWRNPKDYFAYVFFLF
jgi:ADP-ribose pyrophosphatase YjhB (NUDIX family)